MSVTEHAEQIVPAMLIVGDRPALLIASEESLIAGLSQIDDLRDGAFVALERQPKHYIKASRRGAGAFWSVSFRKGPIWTLNGFSLGETEYSDRMVKESRNAGSPWNRLKTALVAPAPENALTAKHVEGLFKAYLLGTEFPIAPGVGGA
ncbi:hypothetical protein [Sphingomonas nostoxanthinifaciens]|uniref:hypothetical protein n=1 Tax=Sphingomonas nostoxanthinifaciens TaxID=2872652 RepID=UPI001CC1D8EE|nr:hypothetical protein [Sphingomonas nostoxanthinifaciens]UAK26140.1 hypothetical protein K8P63_08590 [Sphingomonas nostoxanthinifaciens]